MREANMMKKTQGVTLLEILLVLAVIAIMIIALLRFMSQWTQEQNVNTTVSEIEQLINATTAFYVDNNRWPGTLQTPPIPAAELVPYLPSWTGANGSTWSVTNPWGGTFTVTAPTANNAAKYFTIQTTIPTIASLPKLNQILATTIAGKLPMATANQLLNPTNGAVTPSPGTVTAYVSIPGQNLNNATAVNYTAVYNHGACVPMPNCPVGPVFDPATGTSVNYLQPEIVVAPSSVSGLNDATDNTNVSLPLTSFTAYAIPDTTSGIGHPPDCYDINNPKQTGYAGGSPGDCFVGGGYDSWSSTYNQKMTPVPQQHYWRVCLQIVNQNGVEGDQSTSNPDDYPANQYWYADKVSIAVFTRCAIQNETNVGSTFTITPTDVPMDTYP